MTDPEKESKEEAHCARSCKKQDRDRNGFERKETDGQNNQQADRVPGKDAHAAVSKGFYGVHLQFPIAEKKAAHLMTVYAWTGISTMVLP